jgi:hypothetical protein
VTIVAVDFDLLVQRKADAVVDRAELLDLLGRPRFLLEELVAGEPEHRESAVAVLVVQALQTFVLRREATLRRHVHDECDLVAMVGQVGRTAVECTHRVVVDGHDIPLKSLCQRI